MYRIKDIFSEYEEGKKIGDIILEKNEKREKEEDKIDDILGKILLAFRDNKDITYNKKERCFVYKIPFLLINKYACFLLSHGFSFF